MKPFICLTYSWVVVTYLVEKAISHGISAAAHLIWFYTPRQNEVWLSNTPKFVPVLSCLPLACEGWRGGLTGTGRKWNKITVLAFRHFDDASVLNYPKRTTLYKWFDELFGHFVVFAFGANQKSGRLGRVRATGIYRFKGSLQRVRGIFQISGRNFCWMESAQLLLPFALLYPGLFPCRLSGSKIPISFLTLAITTSCS